MVNCFNALLFAFQFQIVERHFTLDKLQKGTDHSLSLEPNEMRALVAAVREIELHPKPLANLDDATLIDALSALPGFRQSSDAEAIRLALRPISTKKILNCELDCFNKLGKSLVFRECLKAGTKINGNHLCAKVSEPRGIAADRINDFVGQELTKSVERDDLVHDLCFKKIN